MSLFKYTTDVESDKTAVQIAKCLSMHGASAIMTEYDQADGYVTSLSFKIKIDDKEMAFRLPCDWKPVQVILENDSKVSRRYKSREQAVRVAWRIVQAWVEAQMALVETKMVSTQQVFLPYAVMRNGQTLSEHIAQNPEMLLGDGK